MGEAGLLFGLIGDPLFQIHGLWPPYYQPVVYLSGHRCALSYLKPCQAIGMCRFYAFIVQLSGSTGRFPFGLL
jgi:hypothetical protein